jgi:hypothetical protein
MAVTSKSSRRDPIVDVRGADARQQIVGQEVLRVQEAALVSVHGDAGEGVERGDPRRSVVGCATRYSRVCI